MGNEVFLFSLLCPSQYSMENFSKTLRLEDTSTILQQHPYAINPIFAIATILLEWRYFDPYSGTLVPGTPVVGTGSRFEPLFITRYRFTLGSASIISNNWRKVRIVQSAYINGAKLASFGTNRPAGWQPSYSAREIRPRASTTAIDPIQLTNPGHGR